MRSRVKREGHITRGTDMPPRDYDAAPVAENLKLGDVIKGLAQDLQDMRDKKISPQDGMARAAVAKQIFNGVRLYLQATQMLEKGGKPIGGKQIENHEGERQ